MKRLWISLGITAVLLYSSPSLILLSALLTLLACTCTTLYRKWVRNNSESLPALFLNVVLDLINCACRALLRINFVSEVEALRLPNYLTLLIKPHPEVEYERIQIRDDSISLILYRPRAARNKGLIVYAHGGGWVMFTARMFHSAVSWICHVTHMSVVSVDYRRPPDHPFPRPLLDVYDTVLWAQLNAQKLGIDPAKIVVMGDSSGGNLAAGTATLHRDDRELDKHSFPSIAAQVLIYPVLQPYNYYYGSYIEKDLHRLRQFVSYYIAGDLSLYDTVGDTCSFAGAPAYWNSVVEPSLTDPELQVTRSLESSPTNLDNVYAFPLLETDPSGLPPTYVLALTRDAIRDDGDHYARWLDQWGVVVKYVEEENASHGCMFLYGTDTCALVHLEKCAQFVWHVVEREEE